MSTATAVRRRPASAASWWEAEQAVALVDVGGLLPPRPGGAPPSLATVRRWVRSGVHGVRLRVFASGPTALATTREEVARFVRALSAVRGLGA
ncbi:MAG: hypothetical protein INH34_14235 [Phycisphaerales bacterium]|jgi:hypothetical protein|nr:hypothetical protein [Phycisphaerales bacterium]